MKLTLNKLIIAVGALKTLGEDKSLNVKTKYTIARNIRLIQQELDQYEKARVELVQKHGVVAEDGSASVSPNKIKEFSNEINELQSVTIDLDIRKVGEDACANLSANDMSVLDWMLEGDE